MSNLFFKNIFFISLVFCLVAPAKEGGELGNCRVFDNLVARVRVAYPKQLKIQSTEDFVEIFSEKKDGLARGEVFLWTSQSWADDIEGLTHIANNKYPNLDWERVEGRPLALRAQLDGKFFFCQQKQLNRVLCGSSLEDPFSGEPSISKTVLTLAEFY